MLLSIQWVLGVIELYIQYIEYSVGITWYIQYIEYPVVISWYRTVYSLLLSVQWVLGDIELYIQYIPWWQSGREELRRRDSWRW